MSYLFKIFPSIRSYYSDWFSSYFIYDCHIHLDFIIPKKGQYVKSKNYERKIKSPFIIYGDFESILLPDDNGKQNPEESYTNKYQKHIGRSYVCKLVCVDDKFRSLLRHT